jgi:hypothetical protein
MEPVFMILGQSAAMAAAIAIDEGLAVQDVPYEKLREKLLQAGQVLQHSSSNEPITEKQPSLMPDKLKGVVVDDDQAIRQGSWVVSNANGGFVGSGYRHDGDQRNGKSVARFEAKLPKAGKYEVRLSYPPNNNRSSKVRVEVVHAEGSQIEWIDQKKKPDIDSIFVSLGVYDFNDVQPAAVVVSNSEANGFVIVDAVQWLPK